MADSTASGSGSGAGGSDEGRAPKRPRVDEQEPEVSSSQPSAEGRRQGPPQPQQQQQGPSGQQPAAAGSQSNGGRGRGRGIGSRGLLQGRVIGLHVPGLRAPDPGPLIDPVLYSKLPKEKRRRLVKQHKARLERYWDTIIRYYRSMYGKHPTTPLGAAMGAQGQGPQLQVQVYIPAAGGEEAQHGGIPANAANVAAPGDQEAPQAPEAEPEVEDAQDEQAVPEVPGVADGEGGNAEAEPKM